MLWLFLSLNFYLVYLRMKLLHTMIVCSYDSIGMADGKFTLSSNYFEANTPTTFRKLWNDQDFTYVTLATVDNKQIKAHKVNLSYCSPHQNPLLYLTDTRSCEQSDSTFTRYDHIIRYNKSKHEGVMYNCNQFDGSFIWQGALIRHQQSLHEGVRNIIVISVLPVSQNREI